MRQVVQHVLPAGLVQGTEGAAGGNEPDQAACGCHEGHGVDGYEVKLPAS